MKETNQEFIQRCYDKIDAYSPPRGHDITRVMRACQDRLEDLEKKLDHAIRGRDQGLDFILAMRADVAKLETELNDANTAEKNYKAELTRLIDLNARSQACLRSWKEDEGADAKRMEWVLENIWNMDSPLDILSSREAIDYAMKEWKS